MSELTFTIKLPGLFPVSKHILINPSFVMQAKVVLECFALIFFFFFSNRGKGHTEAALTERFVFISKTMTAYNF